jgi:hypothetical protein
MENVMINEKAIEGLREYLKDHYIPMEGKEFCISEKPFVRMADAHYLAVCLAEPVSFRDISDEASDYIKKNRKLDGFAHTLDKKRKEKGLTAVELYKRANVDRRQYSRFMGPEGRHPSMNTVISFALALRLDRQEFDGFLQTAGYALSNSSSRDVCIMYCLEKKIYDIDEVNALLFEIGIMPLTRE